FHIKHLLSPQCSFLCSPRHQQRERAGSCHPGYQSREPADQRRHRGVQPHTGQHLDRHGNGQCLFHRHRLGHYPPAGQLVCRLLHHHGILCQCQRRPGESAWCLRKHGHSNIDPRTDTEPPCPTVSAVSTVSTVSTAVISPSGGLGVGHRYSG